MSVHAQAAFWAAVYLALTVTPLAVLLLAPTPAKGGFWWEVGIGLGFAGLTMMAIQFVLTARFRIAVAPFGIDVIYYFHRYMAYLLVIAVLVHPVLLVAVDPSLLDRINPLSATWAMQSGVAASVLLLALIASSVGRKQLRIPYGLWRPLHLALAIGAIALAFAHMKAIGYYSAVPALQALWVAIGASLGAIVITVRIVRPWLLSRRPYRVDNIASEPGDAWTLTLTPEGHAGFTFEPGQFAWVSLGHSPFTLQEHPFTIMSAPAADGSLAFTIKALGDFTATVGDIAPATRVYVDGPYGAFSIDRHADALGYVFIVGGIGVTPALSMLAALAERGDRRHHVLFAAHGQWDRVPCRDRLIALQSRLDLDAVHVLEHPPADWPGEHGMLTAALLDRHLPAARARYEYFICGPRPMTQAVEHALHALHIPVARMHTELFDMA